MRSSFPLTIVRKCFVMALIVSEMLLTAGCIHGKISPALPAIVLSDTKTKRNIVVGQVFSKGTDGEIAAGPNLQTLGLSSRSIPLGQLSVSQPDITLGEFLNAIGASSASCEASLPWQKVPREGADWFQKEGHTVIGEEVSLLLEDVSEQVADPKSLRRLLRDNSAPPDAHRVVVVQTLYAQQAVLRFRVPEKASLPLASEYFLGPSANVTSDTSNAKPPDDTSSGKTLHDTILTLVKVASACAAQAHARELPDPGLEADVKYLAPMLEGAGLAHLDNGKARAMTNIETLIRLYDEPRLPTPTDESHTPGQERVWKASAGNADHVLQGTKDNPPLTDNIVPFEYGEKEGSYAIMTSPREFNPDDGKPYHRSLECVFRQAPSWWNPFPLFNRAFGREVWYRELALFFGPEPPRDGGDSNDYTSEKVHAKKEGSPSVPKSATTLAVWIYEYHCQGGFAQLQPRNMGKKGVSEHLEGWGLDKPN